MKKITNSLILILVVSVFALICVLPIMSTTSTDGETSTFVIRGFNLISFSPFAVITMIAPVIFLLILYSSAEHHIKELMSIGLLILSIIGFVAGFNNAREWLYESCNTLIEYREIGFFYPFVMPALTAALWFAKEGENKEEEKELC